MVNFLTSDRLNKTLDSSVISKIVLTDVSDHLPTILTTNLSVKNKPHDKKYVYKRVFSDANIAKLKQRLTRVNWKSILHGNSANDDYEVFLKTFTDIYDECIPCKKAVFRRKKEPKSRWITKGLLKSINTKNKLHKDYVKKLESTTNSEFQNLPE